MTASLSNNDLLLAQAPGLLSIGIGFTVAWGECVLCLDPSSGNIAWKTKLVQGSLRIIDHLLTPPVLVNGKVIVGTLFGEVACLCAESGDWLWREIIGEPVNFQPAVANGRVYVPTATGSLDTGDAKDDGWFMWGGDGTHNGTAEPKC